MSSEVISFEEYDSLRAQLAAVERRAEIGNTALRALVGELVGYLQTMEWEGSIFYQGDWAGCCPSCQAIRDRDHDHLSNCGLAAVLAKGREVSG